MKSFGFTVSINKGSNRAVSSSEVDWAQLRESSSIKFGDDSGFYTVSKAEPLFYIKDFTVIDPFTLSIQDDTGINLSKRDTFTITFKENEVSAVLKIINPGKGYKTGDTLYLSGGTPTINIIDNLPLKTRFIVSETAPDGSISQIRVETAGKYIVAPEAICVLEGGSGAGCQLELVFKVSDNRTSFERTAASVENGPSSTIKLSYPVLTGITAGKLSVQKWQAYLTASYTGENKLDVSYHVLRDFTENYNLPLVLQGNPHPETVANEVIRKLDKVIFELEKRLAKLEKH